MWNIGVITEKQYSCEQALLKAVAKYYQRDYQMIFSDSWGFNYSYDEKSIGKKLSPGYAGKKLINYYFFHGIKVQNTMMSSIQDFNLFFHNNISKSPILIEYDTFYCFWNRLYKKMHNFHMLLILDIAKDGYYLCIDQYTNKPMKIKIHKNWKGRVSTFELCSEVSSKKENYLVELKNQGEFLIQQNMIANLESFIKDLTELSGYTEELIFENRIDPSMSPLILNLERIKNQRMCFKEYLEYLNKKNIFHSDIKELISDFESISNKYHILKMMIFKEMIQGSVQDKSTVLRKLLNLEKNTLKKFLLMVE